MRYAFALLFLAGCESTTSGALISAQVMAGAGIVTVQESNLTLRQTDFRWSGTSPAKSGFAAFSFTFGDGTAYDVASLDCNIPWSDLRHQQRIAAMDSCTLTIDVAVPDAGLDPASSWFVEPFAIEITATTSTLDDKGNGTLTLEVDVGSADFVATDSASVVHTVHVEADGLQGRATFEDVASPMYCSGAYAHL